MNIGKGLHRDTIDVDPNVILQGLKDGLGDGKTLMTDDQAQQSLMALQMEVRAQQEVKRKQEAVDNQKAGEAFLAANKNKPGVVTTADGLQYKIITQGTGPKPTIDDVVTVNYKGTLINGKEFDSSYKRGSRRHSRYAASSRVGPKRCSWFLWAPSLSFRFFLPILPMASTAPDKTLAQMRRWCLKWK